jgi:hypothetical protein
MNLRRISFSIFAFLPVLISSQAPAADFLTVSAVGDILMGTTYPSTILPPKDGAELFGSVRQFLRQGEIVFGNLEGPLIDGGTPSKCVKNNLTPQQHCFEFRMPSRYAKHLKEAGFNVLSIANNHSLDFGREGLESTINSVTSEGIQVVGGRYVAAFRIRGKQIALIGFSYLGEGINSYSMLDIQRAREILSQTRTYADHVIVSFHGGAEGKEAVEITQGEETYRGERRGNPVAFARAMIEAGATLVLGHGPHVPRPLEIYRGKLIVYSLGNFVAYGVMNTKGPSGLSFILQVKLDMAKGDFLGGRIVSVELKGRGIPAVDPNTKALNLLKGLIAASPFEGRHRFGQNGELFPMNPPAQRPMMNRER